MRRRWQALFSPVLALLLVSGTSVARLPRPSPLVEKIAKSDLIVVAVATGTKVSPRLAEITPEGRFFLLEVVQNIKSDSSATELRLVTDAMGGESKPSCCRVDGKYLLFLNNGYPVWSFEDQTGAISIDAHGIGEFVSSSDGAFGAFEIEPDGTLSGPGSHSFTLDDVVRHTTQLSDRPQMREVGN